MYCDFSDVFINAAKPRWRVESGVVAATLLACLVALVLPVRAGDALTAHVANPHREVAGCTACHGAGKPATIPIEQADAVCLNCHNGRKAAAEFHSVGGVLEGKGFSSPKGWPLIGKGLGCLTCHDLLPGCKPTDEDKNHAFLRGFDASLGKAPSFCRNCHQDTTYRKLNPHRMLLDGKDQIVHEKCQFCHRKTPDRTLMAREGKPDLTAEQVALCRDCHPQHQDPMQEKHITLKVSKDILARAWARENVGAAGTLTKGLLVEAKTAGLIPRLLVTDENSRIACTTCHNPHQKGVFPRRSDLAYGALQVMLDGRLSSPVRGEVLCRRCHEL